MAAPSMAMAAEVHDGGRRQRLHPRRTGALTLFGIAAPGALAAVRSFVAPGAPLPLARSTGARSVTATASTAARGTAALQMGPASGGFVAGLALVATAASRRRGVAWVDGMRKARSGAAVGLHAGVESTAAPTDNVAIVFLKPHAATTQARIMVPAFLKSKGVQVLRTGSVSSADVDRAGIIDRHYSSIARVGMQRDPAALELGAAAEAKFEEHFGVSMKDALAAGAVHTAATALEALKVSTSEFQELWLAAGCEKLGPGLYVAKMEGPDGQPVFVFNGFYLRMREKFVAPGIIVTWYVVRFDPQQIPWSKFRSEIIGSTDPAKAADGSLRAKFRDEWRAMGLAAECTYQDNAVHASASPLEALKERHIWAGDDLSTDAFAAALLAKGVSEDALLEFMSDAEVEDSAGGRHRVFDLLENMDTEEALDLLSELKLVQ
mmetsp:Transcript_123366/g.356585  ORF Transcript_123366/g.356585 Transcript_123366/m.356585 type:complete len:436 (-) Transcript_123366:126-1433(-)